SGKSKAGAYSVIHAVIRCQDSATLLLGTLRSCFGPNFKRCLRSPSARVLASSAACFANWFANWKAPGSASLTRSQEARKWLLGASARDLNRRPYTHHQGNATPLSSSLVTLRSNPSSVRERTVPS